MPILSGKEDRSWKVYPPFSITYIDKTGKKWSNKAGEDEAQLKERAEKIVTVTSLSEQLANIPPP